VMESPPGWESIREVSTEINELPDNANPTPVMREEANSAPPIQLRVEMFMGVDCNADTES
jgi:hypothetical protein